MDPIGVLHATMMGEEDTGNDEISSDPVRETATRNPHAKEEEGTMDDIQKKGRRFLPTATFEDFMKAAENTNPTVSREDVTQYANWA
jgi:hypothetical protein